MNAALLHNISPERPLVINSYPEFIDVLKTIFTDGGLIKAEEEVKDRLLTTRQAKTRLIEKGYHVNSHVAFKKLMADNNLMSVRKGRDDMWSSLQIDTIPENR